MGNDRTHGDEGHDDVRGGDGSDHVTGGNGADRAYGDAGNDTVDGNSGNDFLDGGSGNDRLGGGDGADILYGGAGADILDAGIELSADASDTMFGGTGNDTFVDHFALDAEGYVSQWPSALVSFNDGGSLGVYIDLESGTATRGAEVDKLQTIFNIEATQGADTVQGHNLNVGGDYPDGGCMIYGIGGNDTIYGSSAGDDLFGGNGNDYINGNDSSSFMGDHGDGGNGHDTLIEFAVAFGGSGNDYVEVHHHDDYGWAEGSVGDDTLIGISSCHLFGGDGNDVLHALGSEYFDISGGSGADVFRIESEWQSYGEIVDFSADQGDLIDLDMIDTDLTAAGDQDFVWIGTGELTASGQLGYYESDDAVVLVGTLDGDEHVDFEIRMLGLASLTPDGLDL
jgi:Ca2+-binding RTX toxin-like protein